MLLGAISKRFDTIVEITSFQNFCSFDKKGENKIKIVENHKIKVTIEVDLIKKRNSTTILEKYNKKF